MVLKQDGRAWIKLTGLNMDTSGEFLWAWKGTLKFHKMGEICYQLRNYQLPKDCAVWGKLIYTKLNAM